MHVTYKTLVLIIAETAKKPIQNDSKFELFYNFHCVLLSQLIEFGVRVMMTVIRTAIRSNSQQTLILLVSAVINY